MKWMEGLLGGVEEVFLPTACAGCRSALGGGSVSDGVCLECRTRLRPPPHPRCTRCSFPLGTGRASDGGCGECAPWPEALTGAVTAFGMEPPGDRLVHGLKYEGWWTLARFMARCLARASVPNGGVDVHGSEPVVVPVPTTSRRVRARGYNQARLLAEAYAELRSLPLWTGLRRRGDANTQVSLHPLERRANVSGAFRVEDGRAVAARNVLLIDDVLTTGATAGAAAVALAETGAGEVWLLAFGRALPRSRRRGE